MNNEIICKKRRRKSFPDLSYSETDLQKYLKSELSAFTVSKDSTSINEIEKRYEQKINELQKDLKNIKEMNVMILEYISTSPRKFFHNQSTNLENDALTITVKALFNILIIN